MVESDCIMVCSTSALLISRLSAFFRACADQRIGFIRWLIFPKRPALVLPDFNCGQTRHAPTLRRQLPILSARRAATKMRCLHPAISNSHRNMSAEVKKQIQLEIAHVLFIDIVGYSKLSINEQHAAVDELTQIVRATDQFQKADASERLIKIATGDGMALVFYTS